MTADGLRKLSSRTLRATILCLVLGIVLMIVVPRTPPGATTDPVAWAVLASAFGLLAISIVANLVSLVSGAMAWLKGAPCPWILLSALAIVAPAGFWIAEAIKL
jgi:hypothetical protein